MFWMRDINDTICIYWKLWHTINMMCSSPIRPVRYHYLVCSENYLYLSSKTFMSYIYVYIEGYLLYSIGMIARSISLPIMLHHILVYYYIILFPIRIYHSFMVSLLPQSFWVLIVLGADLILLICIYFICVILYCSHL